MTNNEGSLMVSLAARSKPRAVEMCYQQTYAESVDWLTTQFKDWALIFMASIFHYELNDPMQVELYRQTIAAFDGLRFSFADGGYSSCVGAFDY